MSKPQRAKVIAQSTLRLPLLALAAQKCELQPGNIMIGLLALADENPSGLTAAKLNKVLFDSARLQLAEQMLSNGVATGELRKEGDSYFLTDYGRTDLGNNKAWVNGQTTSWELLCLGASLGSEVDCVMRNLAARAKIEHGWKPIEDETSPAAEAARVVWGKISQKAQLQVEYLSQHSRGERQGVLLVNEFAEPPTTTDTDKILVRLCQFNVRLSMSDDGKWSIDSLQYPEGTNDQRFSEPFNIGDSNLVCEGPSEDEWQKALAAAGLNCDSHGHMYCFASAEMELDYGKLLAKEFSFHMDKWEIAIRDIPVRARDQEEALQWFSRYLSGSFGKTVATWEEIKSSADRFMEQAGIKGAPLSESDLQAAVLGALATSAHRGDASRLGYILDFES